MDKAYLEFELDGDTIAEVEALAKEANVTPFRMCIMLLEEAVAHEQEPRGLESKL